MIRPPRHLRFVLALVLVPAMASPPLRPAPLDRFQRVPLGHAQLEALRAQEPARAMQLSQLVNAQKSAFGLGRMDELQEAGRLTDSFGRTHVRFAQTYRGVKVWNGTVIGHLDATGQPLPADATVQAGIDLPEVPLLAESQVKAIAEENLPTPGGKLWPMIVRPVVFPTAAQDGLKVAQGADGRFTIDLRYSVAATPKREPYRWAYQVSVRQQLEHTDEGTEFIIDAVTGEVLKKWNGLQHATAPAVGTGVTQFNGTQPVNTLQGIAGGPFELRDTTRATRPWPTLQSFPDWVELGGTGSVIAYTADGTTNPSGQVVYSDLDNTWGTGQLFDFMNNLGLTKDSEAGQTAAVDAAYGIQATWDYYKNVLGRDGGIDGQGSSVVSIVHAQSGPGLSNAYWHPAFFLMVYGDGYPTGRLVDDGYGGLAPETSSLTTLDIAAHEMSHGVMTYTAGLQGGEAQGLNEANSDIHAVMAKYYYWGANGAGSTVPDSTISAPGGNNTISYLWTMAAQLAHDALRPLRWLFKPSKDGVSFDGWFDGIGLYDSHFSMGPGNRAFYFLSQGATVDGETSSVYLPGGMAGIGNDKAIRIWYGAMSTKVTDMGADYHAIREAMIASATELYGPTEVAAVQNAFAAVNVGAPAGGPEPLRVRFKPNPLGAYFSTAQFIVAPSLVPIRLTADVTHASDTSLTWKIQSANPHRDGPPAGRISGDNMFTAPLLPGMSAWPLTAISKQDPNQFAMGLVFAGNFDCDGDTELDATDMGALALSFGGTGAYVHAYLLGPTSIIDIDLFKQAFNTAFNG
jgi:Zn-dependent metalloprotease